MRGEGRKSGKCDPFSPFSQKPLWGWVLIHKYLFASWFFRFPGSPCFWVAAPLKMIFPKQGVPQAERQFEAWLVRHSDTGLPEEGRTPFLECARAGNCSFMAYGRQGLQLLGWGRDTHTSMHIHVECICTCIYTCVETFVVCWPKPFSSSGMHSQYEGLTPMG